MTELYDTIGVGYARYRQEDPAIQRAVIAALGNARSVVNVGAGAGSYEPGDRRVVAVEPSRTMIRQRPSGAAPVLQATADALPFATGTFAAAMAILTVHHWPDVSAGLGEMRRVARERVVVLTWDPETRGPGFWLGDYIPHIAEASRSALPTLSALAKTLGPVDVIEVPVPHDCRDGFLGAYWRRPAAYLEPEVRAAISAFANAGDVTRELETLARDIESGRWRRRYAAILDRAELDLGYRLVVGGGDRGP